MKPFPPTPGSVATYLRELHRALGALPTRDRDAIVGEIASHIAERTLMPNTGTGEVLAGLGAPTALARAYLGEGPAPGTASSLGPRSSLGSAGRGVSSWLSRSAGVACFLLGLGLGAVAACKPIVPGSVGLWVGPGHFRFGILAAPGPAATEVLGWWIVPLALAAAASSWRMAFASMKPGGRRPRHPSRPVPFA